MNPSILCRPGPSVISSLGPDLYSPLRNPTANTFLDSFQARPEDGTVLGPHLCGSPQEPRLQVERFDDRHAANIAKTIKALFEDSLSPEAGNTDVARATKGRWSGYLLGKRQAHFDGPSKRVLEMGLEDGAVAIGVGWEGEGGCVSQKVSFSSFPRTEAYEFYFRAKALAYLKNRLDLPHDQRSTVRAAIDIVKRVCDRNRLLRDGPSPTLDLSVEGSFEIDLTYQAVSGAVSVIGDENTLWITLRMVEDGLQPLDPDLRRLLWDGALAFVNVP